MAEPCNVAFGRYVKRLRERRGLSLDDLHARSQGFPEVLMKGYMSRVENGRQKLAFSKMIPLSRILEVPPDVLVERMELDLELEKVGGPETEGMSYGELFERMKVALDSGEKWDAYAYSRDAIARAPLDPHLDHYTSQDGQVASAIMNNATCAMVFSRFRFAWHELDFVNSTFEMGQPSKWILRDRLGFCSSRLGRNEEALHILDSSIEEIDADAFPVALGSLLNSKAMILTELENHEEAVACFKKAYAAFADGGSRVAQAQAQLNLAASFILLKRFRAARELLKIAKRLVGEDSRHRIIALALILSGDIDATEGHQERAESQWKDAADLSRKTGDDEIRFRAEFRIFKLADEQNRSRTRRVAVKRLTRLAPKISAELPELSEFRAMASS